MQLLAEKDQRIQAGGATLETLNPPLTGVCLFCLVRELEVGNG